MSLVRKIVGLTKKITEGATRILADLRLRLAPSQKFVLDLGNPHEEVPHDDNPRASKEYEERMIGIISRKLDDELRNIGNADKIRTSILKRHSRLVVRLPKNVRAAEVLVEKVLLEARKEASQGKAE